MTKQHMPASNDKKLDFLQVILESAEKRRDAVENKSSIILASNAILLTAIATLGFPTPFTNDISVWLWLKFGLAFISLSGIAISSLCAVQVLAPVTSKQRMRIMKVPAKEFNVFFFGKIAEYENAQAYLADIEVLPEKQILEQLTVQIYNLSRLVMNRYKWFYRSQRALILSILMFIALALTGLF